MKKRAYIIISVTLCAVIMSVVDGFIQPGYVYKSLLKALLFLSVPILYFLQNKDERSSAKKLFLPKGRHLLFALILGAGVYAIIVCGYLMLDEWMGISAFGKGIMEGSGVSRDNFLAVAIYIPVVNSFLEEFIFRGFAFITLKNHLGRFHSYLFSGAAFALYHFGMVMGSFDILSWILSLTALFGAGLVLNYLNEKSGTIYTSWLVHMLANIGINTVGLIILEHTAI